MASKTATKRTSQRTRSKQSRRRSQNTQNTHNNSNDKAFFYILMLFGSFALSLLLMIAVLGFGGTFGIASRYVLFGLFGVFAYLFPVALAGGTYYSITNRENKALSTKVIAACITYLLTTVLLELFLHGEKPLGGFDGFATSQQLHTGGGMIGGFFSGLFVRMFGVVGAYVISFAGLAICLVFLTDKMPINRLQEDSDIRRKKRELRQRERESEREYMRAQRRIREEEAYRAKEANFLREEKRRESELRYYERKQQELRKQQLLSMTADTANGGGVESQQTGSRSRAPYEPTRGKGISLNTTILPTSNAHGSDEVNEIILPDDDPLPESETAVVAAEAAQQTTIKDKTEEVPQIVASEPEPVPVTELPFRDPDEPLGHYFAEPVPISDRTDGLEEAASFVMHEKSSVSESKSSTFDTNIVSRSESDDMKPVDISDFEDTSNFEETNNLTREFTADEPLFEAVPVESTRYEAEIAEAEPVGSTPFEAEVVEAEPVESFESSSDAAVPEIAEETDETVSASTTDDRSEYIFPTPDLLTKQRNRHNADRSATLQETAGKLQQTLENFGVKVTITDACCGPTVTRYELQPQKGVKVSKIVNLADDIKLNLAAEDIRIEAPIPGKAAVGIEVPNKEAAVVSFRELMESNEFQQTASPIAFAAGRDIAGNIMISDIAKMPHVLIAGATGSGKSVCINTIIMSILFKAHPDDVKFIMIDPKVVELSVYNGIPHLLIPVVTDPKKAAGALRWAVKEMMDRYESFAKTGVRDMKGYNAKIRDGQISYDMNGETVTVAAKKLPQIVVIVDELADLMMVASNEVEEAICRLAQLARAAGIHLVIATQRPSVNVITGLIKANMPSRIAFAVTSGVDSRTILDMTGAEKLLGKGDMLYYPQGFTKPLRVQGAFVMDEDVAKVVDFIRANTGKVSYDPTIEDTIKESPSTDQSVAISTTERSDDKDQYFEEAARLLIDKEKGSIGMLQRYFKVGFNRAARIMDQLEEAGVVGPEEGTKPRKILMTLEQFEGEGEANEE